MLQVGAAESVLLVHVDGRPVGISKDSHLAAEFDLTDVVRPGERSVVRLTVVKWSDASHIEDQDQWWHGGITRSVLLYATDPLYLADVTVRAAYDGDLRVDCRVRDTRGALPEGWYVSGDLDGRLLAQDTEFDRVNAEDDRVSDFLGEARVHATIPDVRTWNAETPSCTTSPSACTARTERSPTPRGTASASATSRSSAGTCWSTASVCSSGA